MSHLSAPIPVVVPAVEQLELQTPRGAAILLLVDESAEGLQWRLVYWNIALTARPTVRLPPAWSRTLSQGQWVVSPRAASVAQSRRALSPLLADAITLAPLIQDGLWGAVGVVGALDREVVAGLIDRVPWRC
ncbi:MAG: hypothetical protein AAFQ82_15670 [Myxococcota bacterium]